MFEAFKIGVKISLMSNAASVLGAIATQLRTVDGHVNGVNRQFTQLEKALERIKTKTLVGGAMAGAGLYGLSMFKAPLDEAKKYEVEMQRIFALGMGDKASKDAIKFAQGMKTYGTSALENMTMMRDAMTIFADVHHAEMVTPLLARMKFANNAMFGSESGAQKERTFMNMLKVIELRGGLASKDKFEHEANMVQRVITATGGRVGPDEWLNFIKTGGVAAKSLKDSAFYYQMEPLIQEMGGQRVGTGLMSAYQNLFQGRTSVRSAQEMMRLGLLDPSMVEYNKIGMVKQVRPGALAGGDLFKSSPVEWMESVLLPKLAAKGITGDEGIKDTLGTILGNRTASNLLTQMFLQRSQIRKNERLNAGADDIDSLYGRAKDTLAGKEIDLRAKWRDVLKELGMTVLPVAIRAVEGLTSVLKSVSRFAQEFPTLTKGVVILFGVLAGAAAVGGVVMLASAAFTALGTALAFVGGGAVVAALGTAFTAIGAVIGPVALGLASVAATLGLMKFLTKEAKAGPTSSHGALEDFYAGRGNQSGRYYGLTSKAGAGRGNGYGDVYLDGRKVGVITSKHQAKELGRPATGGRGFDGSMTLRAQGAH